MSPRNKRPDGEGTITAHGPGKWRIVTPRSPGQRPVSRIVTGSKADARAALRQLVDEQQRRTVFDGRIRLREFSEEWLADIERSRARATHYSYTSAFKNHITPGLGDISLEELTALHVGKWLRELSCGDRTRQNAFKVLRMALQTAVTQRLIEHNPTAGIEIPKSSRTEPDPFTESEVQTLVNSLPSSPWYLFVRLGFATGARQGELLGLQWQDVDASGATIEIRRQAVEIAGKMAVGDVKTSAARRTVPVPEHLIGELLERRRSAMAIGQAADECHVFARPGGVIPQRSNFGKRHWKPLLAVAGIRHRGFHHARHTFATLQISAGVPITLVSAILGHAKVSTTLDIYARWLPSDVEKARAVGRRMFG